MLLARALAFLEGLWWTTRSAHPMQVWQVERWLRDHRWTIVQFREFLASAANKVLIAATAITTSRRLMANPPGEIGPYLETELKSAANQYA